MATDNKDVLERLGDYTEAILKDGEDNDYSIDVVIGRTNFDRDVLDDDVIVVDYTTATLLGRGETFDGVREMSNHLVLTKYHATITSYGENARKNIEKIGFYTNSQLSYDLQSELGFTVFNFSRISNLREVQGLLKQTRGEGEVAEMYEIQLTLHSYDNMDIGTRRIDSVQGAVFSSTSPDQIEIEVTENNDN